MKILYLFRSLAVWGGIERILVDKMNYLSEQPDVEVYMLTSDQGNHSLPYSINAKVHFEDLDICFYRQYHFSLVRRLYVRKEMISRYERLLRNKVAIIRPDVIVCTTADMIPSILKIKESIPLVVESHSICVRSITYGRNLLLRTLNKYCFLNNIRKADVVVALTEGDAKEWREYHPSVVTIPNVVHLNQGEVSSVTAKKVIFVGRFDYQKRVQEAIRIWSKIRQKYPDWILEIYGEGELQKEIETDANRVGGIIINSPTCRIFDCYRDSSILMSTSLFEPFGLVIPEAMSCGIPVIAYDCPYGPADIISDGVDGFLIKHDDTCAFVEKLSLLMSNQDLRKKMGENGKQSVSRYDASCIMPLWLNLFQRINHKNNKKVN